MDPPPPLPLAVRPMPLILLDRIHCHSSRRDASQTRTTKPNEPSSKSAKPNPWCVRGCVWPLRTTNTNHARPLAFGTLTGGLYCHPPLRWATSTWTTLKSTRRPMMRSLTRGRLGSGRQGGANTRSRRQPTFVTANVVWIDTRRHRRPYRQRSGPGPHPCRRRLSHRRRLHVHLVSRTCYLTHVLAGTRRA